MVNCLVYGIVIISAIGLTRETLASNGYNNSEYRKSADETSQSNLHHKPAYTSQLPETRKEFDVETDHLKYIRILTVIHPSDRQKLLNYLKLIIRIRQRQAERAGDPNWFAVNKEGEAVWESQGSSRIIISKRLPKSDRDKLFRFFNHLMEVRRAEESKRENPSAGNQDVYQRYSNDNWRNENAETHIRKEMSQENRPKPINSRDPVKYSDQKDDRTNEQDEQKYNPSQNGENFPNYYNPERKQDDVYDENRNIYQQYSNGNWKNGYVDTQIRKEIVQSNRPNPIYSHRPVNYPEQGEENSSDEASGDNSNTSEKFDENSSERESDDRSSTAEEYENNSSEEYSDDTSSNSEQIHKRYPDSWTSESSQDESTSERDAKHSRSSNSGPIGLTATATAWKSGDKTTKHNTIGSSTRGKDDSSSSESSTEDASTSNQDKRTRSSKSIRVTETAQATAKKHIRRPGDGASDRSTSGSKTIPEDDSSSSESSTEDTSKSNQDKRTRSSKSVRVTAKKYTRRPGDGASDHSTSGSKTTPEGDSSSSESSSGDTSERSGDDKSSSSSQNEEESSERSGDDKSSSSSQNEEESSERSEESFSSELFEWFDNFNFTGSFEFYHNFSSYSEWNDAFDSMSDSYYFDSESYSHSDEGYCNGTEWRWNNTSGSDSSSSDADQVHDYERTHKFSLLDFLKFKNKMGNATPHESQNASLTPPHNATHHPAKKDGKPFNTMLEYIYSQHGDFLRDLRE